MLVTLITVLHVLVCIFLILVILLQAGKDAGMGLGVGSGGGSAGTVFGGRGAGSFLGKVTAICASIFFITSFTLAFVSSSHSSVTDLIEAAPPPQPETPPKSEKIELTPVDPSEVPGGAAIPVQPAPPAEPTPVVPAP